MAFVDPRLGSPTLGEWQRIEATAENRKQVWAPASFARGFCALTNDVDGVIISEKERNAPTLSE